MNFHRALKSATRTVLRRYGYDLSRAGAMQARRMDSGLAEFKAARKSIIARHEKQTAESIAALNARYTKPVFGELHVWELFKRLAYCVDPTDPGLLNTSQYIHVLQVLEAMEKDGVQDRSLYMAAILHDLGKLLLLTPELPENIACLNSPVGEFEPRSGLENVLIQWNHDEFAYMRLKDHVPEEVAWLIRFHSINLDRCEPYMDDRDRAWRDKLLLDFRRYDFGSKSTYHHPELEMDKYRAMIEEAFPDPIPF